MKTSPSLTTKALNLHNAVLKRAAHVHAGHVFEQEGDSWAVAFHEAQDAVAFCMQAQLALHKARLNPKSRSRSRHGGLFCCIARR